MIKYVIPDDGYRMIKFDTETDECTTCDYIRSSLNSVFIISEDGEIHGTSVKEGDLVFVMYPIGNSNDAEIIVITDPKLKNYYKRMIEYRKEYEKKCNEDLVGCCPDSGR